MITEDGLLKAVNDSIWLYEKTHLYDYFKSYLDASNHLRLIGYQGNIPRITLSETGKDKKN